MTCTEYMLDSYEIEKLIEWLNDYRGFLENYSLHGDRMTIDEVNSFIKRLDKWK